MQQDDAPPPRPCKVNLGERSLGILTHMLRIYLSSFFARYRAELWQVLAVVLATLLSFIVASSLNLAEPFWSVISAAIIARITARGALRLAVYRLLGTLAGALFGLILAYGRRAGISDIILLGLLVAPLSLLGVLRRELRAALIAGLIVFSATSQLASPVAPALARITEVGIGAIIAALVSILLGAIFRPPKPARRRATRQ
jgi:uncharacterized membrane protein YccC